MKLFKIFLLALLAGYAYTFPVGIEHRLKPERTQHRKKPYGLERIVENGFGDRYYSGIPANHYQHMWPEWKREIWYTIGDWNNEEAPGWIAYYDYPYVVWPNYYRYFGSPYYTRAQREDRRRAKAKSKLKIITHYDYDYDNAAF